MTKLGVVFTADRPPEELRSVRNRRRVRLAWTSCSCGRTASSSEGSRRPRPRSQQQHASRSAWASCRRCSATPLPRPWRSRPWPGSILVASSPASGTACRRGSSRSARCRRSRCARSRRRLLPSGACSPVRASAWRATTSTFVTSVWRDHPRCGRRSYWACVVRLDYAPPGRVADGTILAEPSAPAYIRWARERIEEGRASPAEPIRIGSRFSSGAASTPTADMRAMQSRTCCSTRASPCSSRRSSVRRNSLSFAHSAIPCRLRL